MTTAGFVYRDGDAYAIYHATLHHHADGPRADLAIGIGQWDSDEAVADAAAFVTIWSSDSEVQFGFVNPSDSGWSGGRLLQRGLTAAEARNSGLRPDFLYIAEAIVHTDMLLRDHLL